MKELVERARAGDEEAFSLLIQGMRDSMYRIAWAVLRCDADAADAMQEAAIKCWLNLSELREPAYFKTWATRILVNECYALTRRKKETFSMDEAPDRAVSENGYAIAEWQMLLSRLPERSRTVVTLYYVEGYRVAEVARIMGANENTVKTWLAMARSQYESLIS